MAIKFISFKDFDKARTLHTKIDNIQIMMGRETDEIIKELFELFLQRYRERLEESMKEKEFIFDCFDVLYHSLKKISLNRGGSYIDSPELSNNKKSTINPKDNDDKCFQYAVTLALIQKDIVKDSQIISKIKPFIDEYIWKEISFPSHKKDWKKFE